MPNENEERLRPLVAKHIRASDDYEDIKDVVRLHFDEDKSGKWPDRYTAVLQRWKFTMHEVGHATKNLWIEKFRQWGWKKD